MTIVCRDWLLCLAPWTVPEDPDATKELFTLFVVRRCNIPDELIPTLRTLMSLVRYRDSLADSVSIFEVWIIKNFFLTTVIDEWRSVERCSLFYFGIVRFDELNRQ